MTSNPLEPTPEISIRRQSFASSSLALRCFAFSSIAASAIALAGCASQAETAPASQASNIINGTAETGYPEVVFVGLETSQGEGGCTGTVIHPRVVLTAKHCVMETNDTTGVSTFIDPANMIVGVGTSVRRRNGLTATYRVSQVRSVPGTNLDYDIALGNDIALLVLNQNVANVTPRATATEGPFAGEESIIIGFGRIQMGTSNQALSSAGTKYSGTTTVTKVGRVNLQSQSSIQLNADPAGSVIETAGTAAWTCQGDSGGPMLDPQGRVTGITSFGVDGSCSSSTSYSTRVSSHQALIAQTIALAENCTPTTETCDGVDNDCNGLVDDAQCLDVQTSCVENTQCKSNSCAMRGAGKVCVQVCYPDKANTGCGAGYQCQTTQCGLGDCVVAEAGARRNGENCGEHSDCESFFCSDIGNGQKICGQQCFPSGGSRCAGGAECLTGGSTCGVCSTEGSDSGRIAGEACGAASECASELCEGGVCVATCTEHTQCGEEQHCANGRCAAGAPSAAYSYCVDSTLCPTATPFCVENTCTKACGTSGGDECPANFVCETTEAGSRCVSQLSALGNACTSNESCQSGICAGTCTIICDSNPNLCPANFECRQAGGHKGCFPAARKGGCSMAVASTGEPGVWGACFLSVFALASLRRRKHAKVQKASAR